MYPMHSFQKKTFVCWVKKVGGLDMEHTDTEDARGLCTKCLPILKNTCNRFKVPKERVLVFPANSQALEKDRHNKDFWYTFRYKGKAIVARDVSVGKHSPLKIYFIRSLCKPWDEDEKDLPVNPDSDMWFSYKFGIHDFALYKWKGEKSSLDTNIQKAVRSLSVENEIKSKATGDPKSGVVFICADEKWIYFQDLEKEINKDLLNLSVKRNRKTQPLKVVRRRLHHVPIGTLPGAFCRARFHVSLIGISVLIS
mmetsp:Transcript_20295/g.28330  ORF Transcript_20295/g.28330 Transcript_20295/m.28330 type:complete len:253 (+) Transcript_20295:268-1026(+)